LEKLTVLGEMALLGETEGDLLLSPDLGLALFPIFK